MTTFVYFFKVKKDPEKLKELEKSDTKERKRKLNTKVRQTGKKKSKKEEFVVESCSTEEVLSNSYSGNLIGKKHTEYIEQGKENLRKGNDEEESPMEVDGSVW